MSQLLNQFLPWESSLKQILDRYPEPSKLYVTGKSPSTVRQNLQHALRLFLQNPHFSSVLDHTRAELLDRSFVFAHDPDGTVYVGPRRPKRAPCSTQITHESSPPPTIPPIDCSNPVTLNAILHLKNFDHLPIPITIANYHPQPDIAFNYPNIEIIPNADSTFTVL